MRGRSNIREEMKTTAEERSTRIPATLFLAFFVLKVKKKV
jgi:hypothetical protein